MRFRFIKEYNFTGQNKPNCVIQNNTINKTYKREKCTKIYNDRCNGRCLRRGGTKLHVGVKQIDVIWQWAVRKTLGTRP
jgi:hypothetical protein